MEAKTITRKEAHNAVPLARVTVPAAIDPERVYLGGRTSKARTASLVGAAKSAP